MLVPRLRFLVWVSWAAVVLPAPAPLLLVTLPRSTSSNSSPRKGVEVKIVTAASNTYEEKLKSEMSKSSAPTLFQVNGPTGLKNWKDYCADLSDTKLRGELIDDSLALQSDGKDLGIDWVQATRPRTSTPSTS